MEILPLTDVRDELLREIAQINRVFFDLMRDSKEAFDGGQGAFGLKVETCRMIAGLSLEQSSRLVDLIESPIISVAVGRKVDNGAMDEMDSDVREAWGALAGSVGVWVRLTLRYHDQSLRALLGQGCRCELSSNGIAMSELLQGGYGPLRSCVSRYGDKAWQDMASTEDEAMWDVIWKRNQVRLMHGLGACGSCPRAK